MPIKPKKTFLSGRLAAISFFPFAQNLCPSFGGSSLAPPAFENLIFWRRSLKKTPFPPTNAAARQIFCGKVFFSFPVPKPALPEIPNSSEERPPPCANALCLFLAGDLLLPTANKRRGQFLRVKLSFPACSRFSFQRKDSEFGLGISSAQKSGKQRFPFPKRAYSKGEVFAK